MQPRILLADDHSMIRKGLKFFLEHELGFHQISEVYSCTTLMRELVHSSFTHLVLDIIFPDGNTLEIIPNIRKLYPSMDIMIFSMQPAEVYADAFYQHGIEYYLPKSVPEEEIFQVLKKFTANLPIPKKQFATPTEEHPFKHLAQRELEVLHYMLKGIGTKEIADVLNLKMSTVSTLKSRIYEKTKAANYKELLELAALYNISY
jgi:DNA-binding NarL/FixJ family response regulator